MAVRRGSLFAPSILTRLVDHYLASPRGVGPRGFQSFTVREVEVLTLIGRGPSNEEIAAHLDIAMKTVKTHVSHLLAKSGSRDRAQLVVAAFDAGLVQPRPPATSKASARKGDGTRERSKLRRVAVAC